MHKEIEEITKKYSTIIKEINSEKELLISQNCELKKQVAQSSFD